MKYRPYGIHKHQRHSYRGERHRYARHHLESKHLLTAFSRGITHARKLLCRHLEYEGWFSCSSISLLILDPRSRRRRRAIWLPLQQNLNPKTGFSAFLKWRRIIISSGYLPKYVSVLIVIFCYWKKSMLSWSYIFHWGLSVLLVLLVMLTAESRTICFLCP